MKKLWSAMLAVALICTGFSWYPLELRAQEGSSDAANWEDELPFASAQALKKITVYVAGMQIEEDAYYIVTDEASAPTLQKAETIPAQGYIRLTQPEDRRYILTLNNFAYGPQGEYNDIIKMENGDCTVELVGENKLSLHGTGDREHRYALHTPGSLTLQGTGSLNITGAYPNSAVRAGENITINHVAVKIDHTAEIANYRHGLWSSDGDIILNHAPLTVNAPGGGIVATIGNITIDDSTVTATVGFDAIQSGAKTTIRNSAVTMGGDIQSNADIDISNSTVNATKGIVGISTKTGSVTISDSTVNIAAESSGISANRDIIINDSTVTAIADSPTFSQGLSMLGRGNLVIGGSSTVTVKGKTPISFYGPIAGGTVSVSEDSSLLCLGEIRRKYTTYSEPLHPSADSNNFLYKSETDWVMMGNVIVPEGVTFTVPENEILTIPEDATLVNHGTVKAEGLVIQLGKTEGTPITGNKITQTGNTLKPVSAEQQTLVIAEYQGNTLTNCAVSSNGTPSSNSITRTDDKNYAYFTFDDNLSLISTGSL